jgi:hypothetical protein
MISILMMFLVIVNALDGHLVIVFTFKRVDSLRRLVDSVAASNCSDRISLHICCDRDVNGIHEPTRLYLQTLQWRRGDYSFKLLERNVGLTLQWLNCGADLFDRYDNTVLLEDDLELSPFALAWLLSARRRYANDPDVIGYSLQRQVNCFHLKDCRQPELHLPWTVTEYKYVLIGTWGFAPVTSNWRKFRQWYSGMSTNSSFIPVPNILPTMWYYQHVAEGRVHAIWDVWFSRFCDDFRLFSVYYNDPLDATLASHWAEPGLHYNSPPKQDFPILLRPTASIDVKETLILGWDARYSQVEVERFEIASFLALLKSLPLTPLISFVHVKSVRAVDRYLRNLLEAALHLVVRLVFVALDRAIFAYLLKIQSSWGFHVAALGGHAELGDEHVLINTVGFNRLVKYRLRATEALLLAGVSAFLVTPETTICEDFALALSSNNHDVVRDSQFLFLRSTKSTKRLWASILRRHEDFELRFALASDRQLAGSVDEERILSEEIFSAKRGGLRVLETRRCPKSSS